MRISAFIDCDSESAVIRVPYKLLAEMVKNCPASEDLEELKIWLKRVGNRSKKFREVFEEVDSDGRGTNIGNNTVEYVNYS